MEQLCYAGKMEDEGGVERDTETQIIKKIKKIYTSPYQVPSVRNSDLKSSTGDNM